MYLTLLDLRAVMLFRYVLYFYSFTDREKNIHNRQQLEGQLTENNLVKTVTFPFRVFLHLCVVNPVFL